MDARCSSRRGQIVEHSAWLGEEEALLCVQKRAEDGLTQGCDGGVG